MLRPQMIASLRFSSNRMAQLTATCTPSVDTNLDVGGVAYTAQMSLGGDKRHNNTNYRLRAAVVETPKGN